MIHWILVRPEFSHSVAPMYAIAFATATSLFPSPWHLLRATLKRMIERSYTKGKPCPIT